MKLLSRWFRRAPTPPSWIEPVALATRLERYASLLVLDVRGPDEFTGPLGHIREAKNVPLNELTAHLPDLIGDDRPVVVVCKPTVDRQWRRSSCGRPGWRICRYYAAGWIDGGRSACQQADRRLKSRT